MASVERKTGHKACQSGILFSSFVNIDTHSAGEFPIADHCNYTAEKRSSKFSYFPTCFPRKIMEKQLNDILTLCSVELCRLYLRVSTKSGCQTATWLNYILFSWSNLAKHFRVKSCTIGYIGLLSLYEVRLTWFKFPSFPPLQVEHYYTKEESCSETTAPCTTVICSELFCF